MIFSFNSGMFTSTKIQRKKFGVGSLIIMVVVAIMFIAGGVIVVNSSKIDPSWNQIQGRVVDFTVDTNTDDQATYTPTIEYEVDGKSYKTKSNLSSSSKPVKGEAKEVAYNPDNPSEAKVKGGLPALFQWLLPVIGVSLLIVAPIMFIKSLKRSDNINKLKQTGQKLQGVIIDIQSYTRPSENRSGVSVSDTSYRIIASATDISGNVQNYTSDELTGIGGLAMADFRSNPIPVDVYIDPTNSQNYYVDISELPNLTPERIKELIASSIPQMQSIPSPQVVSEAQAAPQALAQQPQLVQNQPEINPQSIPNQPQAGQVSPGAQQSPGIDNQPQPPPTVPPVA